MCGCNHGPRTLQIRHDDGDMEDADEAELQECMLNSDESGRGMNHVSRCTVSCCFLFAFAPQKKKKRKKSRTNPATKIATQYMFVRACVLYYQHHLPHVCTIHISLTKIEAESTVCAATGAAHSLTHTKKQTNTHT